MICAGARFSRAMQEVARENTCSRSCNGFADRCTQETAYNTRTESVARALEVLVNQYDWLRGPLTVRVVKRLKSSAVVIVGVTL
jgi:hypothetical protein